MAIINFSSPSLTSLAAMIVIWTMCANAGPVVSPTATSKAIVRREATREQIDSIVEVKLGISVMQRFIVSKIIGIP